MTLKMIFDSETREASSSEANAVATSNVEGSTTPAQRPTSLLGSTLNTPTLSQAPSFPSLTPDVTPTLVITPTTLNSILGLSSIPSSPVQSLNAQEQAVEASLTAASFVGPSLTAASFVGPSLTAASFVEPSASTSVPSSDTDIQMQLESSLESLSAPSVESIPQTLTKRAFSTVEEDEREITLDTSLAKAAVSAIETGKITPLIKEELKYSIQNKRLRIGQDELTVEFKDPEPERLTEEEEQKRKRRRERNRLAAQRCRNKRKDRMVSLEDESKELMASNSSLRKQIRMLELEKQKLGLLLRCHDISDQCPHKTQLSVSDDNVVITDVPSVASSEQTVSIFSDTDSDSDDGNVFELPGASNEVEVSTSSANN